MVSKIMKGTIAISIIVFIAWIVWMCTGTRTVDLTEYTKVTFSGNSGSGIAILDFDSSNFLEDMKITAEIDKQENLSNGDIVTISYSYDPKACLLHGVKIKKDKAVYKAVFTDTKTEAHPFFAPDDMNDVAASNFLNVISKCVTEDIEFAASIGTKNEYSISNEQIVGVYYDTLSNAMDVLYKANVTMERKALDNQEVYLLYKFNGIYVDVDGSYFRLNDVGEKITTEVFDSMYSYSEMLGATGYDITDTYFGNIYYVNDKQTIDDYYASINSSEVNYEFMDFAFKKD